MRVQVQFCQTLGAHGTLTAPITSSITDTGKESSLQDSAHLPGHFLKSLPPGPRVTAPSHLPSPHSRPHQAICHPGPPWQAPQPYDSAPSPEAALWVATPEPWRGGRCWEGGLSWGWGRGRRHVQTPGGLSRAPNPDSTAFIRF